MRKKLFSIFILTLFMLLMIGCSDKQRNLTFKDYDLTSISSMQELKKLVKPETVPWWRDWFGGNKAVDDAVEAPNSEDYNDSEGTSKTNVQVAGVDESDIIKNDSRYIYIANYIGIAIVDTVTEQIYTKTFENFIPSELFLYGSKLVVLGTTYQEVKYDYDGIKILPVPDMIDYGRCFYYQSYCFKTIILDVKDPANIVVDREFEVKNSYYIQGRMIDNVLYLILSSNRIYDYSKKEPILPAYSDTVEGVENKDLTLDHIKVIGGEKTYYSYTILTSFEVDRTENANIDAYLGYFQTVYSSKNNLYLTKYAYIYPENDSATDELDVISVSTQYTMIYRFAYQDKKMIYQNNAAVEGHIYNQFSLDEYDQVLRVAHINYTKDYVTETFVTTFDVSEPNKITKLASIGGMGIGEQIYSTRFDGRYGYIVTFKAIDPLYVVDLIDPSKPIVRSELKSPGVSDYLHFVNDELLLGIGRSTEQTQYGATISTGVKISLFDISNPDETKEVDVLKVRGEYSYTELQYNHKALLTLPSKQIYAIPIYGYHYGNEFTYTQGMYVFHVNAENQKLEYYGTISHLSFNGYYDYNTTVVRGVIINNKIYTISQAFVGINELNPDLTPIKKLTLPTMQNQK